MIKYRSENKHIQDVKPGMVLGQALLSMDGLIILSEGTLLTERLLYYLRQWGISELPIQVSYNAAIDVARRQLAEERKRFHNVYKTTVSVVKETFETTRFTQELPLETMCDLLENTINPLVNAKGVVNHMFSLKQVDEYTFQHSVNVSVVCGTLGRWLGYGEKELQNLMMSGLLHDVGKSQIPLEILNKPSRLLSHEMEVMKLHTRQGYELVNRSGGLTWDVVCGVLQHHERLDGSGYPLGLKGAQIHRNAQIIAVADIYDAMTSNRVYRKKLTPFHVVEALREEMFGKIDPTICAVFLNNVSDYLVGNVIRLSNGLEAEVVSVPRLVAARPVVRTGKGDFIDLEIHKEIGIVELVAKES